MDAHVRRCMTNAITEEGFNEEDSAAGLLVPGQARKLYDGRVKGQEGPPLGLSFFQCGNCQSGRAAYKTTRKDVTNTFPAINNMITGM